MNIDILTETEYNEQFKARYEGWRTLRPAVPTGLEWWDDVKSRIKQFTIEYCVARARRRREEFLSLCSRERNGDSSAPLFTQSSNIRIRAHVHCVEAEEKPTIKFYRDVSQYAIDRRIKAVRDAHGTVQKDLLDIVEVFRSFYEKLYTQVDVEGLQIPLLDNIDKSSTKEQNDELGAAIDCRRALEGSGEDERRKGTRVRRYSSGILQTLLCTTQLEANKGILPYEGHYSYYVNSGGRFAVQCGGSVPGHFL
ncbi:hypothetical protein HOLleu_16704 [Holothuria leucospilota]|uniref:Uncharacterized protein n=1 Tax=Holothuria leucospilota TaxID=206669 RepID=A0A9Q1HAS7_HOLLE|nr:hypothetical protein HOLleu_16704 [Holothuria leucospilota]